jgi:hypothetical protein
LIVELLRFLSAEERQEGEPEAIPDRWLGRLVQARTMRQYRAALCLIGDDSGVLYRRRFAGLAPLDGAELASAASDEP